MFMVKLSQDMWKKTADMNWDHLKNVCTHWLEFMMRACFPVVLLEYRMFSNSCMTIFLMASHEFLQAFNLFPANEVQTYDQLKEYKKVRNSYICYDIP